MLELRTTTSVGRVLSTQMEGEELLRGRRGAARAPGWLQQAHPHSALTGIAYFSMEFMLSEVPPVDSGELGNVAGDQLKAASDLGVPVIGVGLLWAQAYGRKVIERDGARQAVTPSNVPRDLPIRLVQRANGECLRLRLDVVGRPLWLRAWQVQVGRARLYLLDSNDAANCTPDREITSELYGRGSQLRLLQEVVLGIGGWRLLAALGIEPEVCHLNDGHAALATLERARSFMHTSGQPFEVALAVTRAGNLFTTHTVVAAGFDHFPPALIEQTLGDYVRQELGIPVHDLLALGRLNPRDPVQDFNMAYLAIRASTAVDGVSRLHGADSRHLFQPLFTGWPVEEVPVGHITKGVRMPSRDSAQVDRAVREYTEKHYLPAAAAYRERAANKGAKGAEIVQWRHTLDEKWAALSFGKLSVMTVDAQHVFEVEVHLDELDPDAVRVELYAEAGSRSMLLEMARVRALHDISGGYVYGVKVPAVRPATDFTPRIIANHPDVAVPLEAEFILWQR